MIRVLYDPQAFDLQTHGGVSRCFVELYGRLPEDIDARFSVVETDNVYGQSLGIVPEGDTWQRFCPSLPHGIRKFLYKLVYNCRLGHAGSWDKRPKLNQYNCEQDLRKQDYDVFHPTFFDDYFLPMIGNKPFVLTIHDMIPEMYPQYFDADNPQIIFKRNLASKATHIVAVSEQTKIDTIKLLGVPEDKITVIYHGADEEPYIPGERTVEDRYILFVGARTLYKNFRLFAEAVAPLLHATANLKVVCTGKGFDDEEQQMFRDLGVEGRFVNIFARDDQQLFDLYHYAECFVYPSEYEGFGIPILEAWKTDCPVVLNDTPVFREVGGDAACYFRFNDVTSLTDELTRMLSLTPAERQQLIDRQRQRLSLFSWKKAAEQLAEVYRRVVK